MPNDASDCGWMANASDCGRMANDEPADCGRKARPGTAVPVVYHATAVAGSNGSEFVHQPPGQRLCLRSPRNPPRVP